jgi:hypothetical protein
MCSSGWVHGLSVETVARGRNRNKETVSIFSRYSTGTVKFHSFYMRIFVSV